MDFWTRCTSGEGMSVCMTGVLIGIILTLILIFIYMSYLKGAEYFIDPNEMDPQTRALLAIHNSADPPSGFAMKKMYGTKA